MWISRAVGSSAESPTVEQMQLWHQRMSRPENEFPAVVGLEVMLGRTDDVAVGITHVEVFSTGFQFNLAVRLRQARPEHARGGLYALLYAGQGPGPGIDIALEDRLLLGIEYPNGSRASTLQDARMLAPSAAMGDGQQVTLVQHGGGGGEQSIDQTYWVAPVPPDGRVTFVLAWPSFGIPESRTVIDGSALRTAANRSQLLWPAQPNLEPPPPPPPPRPSSGWFAGPDS